MWLTVRVAGIELAAAACRGAGQGRNIGIDDAFQGGVIRTAGDIGEGVGEVLAKINDAKIQSGQLFAGKAVTCR